MAMGRAVLSGNYKDLPAHYSSELRRIVEAMLQLNAEDRPSITDILQLPIIKRTMEEIFNDEDFKQEYTDHVVEQEL